jgi:hypothetical protein
MLGGLLRWLRRVNRNLGAVAWLCFLNGGFTRRGRLGDGMI